MRKTVLWIDDDADEREFAGEVLAELSGIQYFVVGSSDQARQVLESESVDAVVTDILRRRADRSISTDDGYEFFRSFIRPSWSQLPVIFHTKNMPGSFEVDDRSHYLSKWEERAKKSIELETLLHDQVCLYEAFADYALWRLIEPRLVQVQRRLLESLRSVDDIWLLTDAEFEELIAELLDRVGYKVLWVPGGKDGGVDVVAGSKDHRYLIDVKRYRTDHPVSVELVRRVYGVAEAANRDRPGLVTRGGIITSSRFTTDAKIFRSSVQERPLLKDGEWVRSTLATYAPWLTRR